MLAAVCLLLCALVSLPALAQFYPGAGNINILGSDVLHFQASGARAVAIPRSGGDLIVVTSDNASRALRGNYGQSSAFAAQPLSGTPPRLGTHFGMVFDPVHEQIVVTGGNNVKPGLVGAVNVSSWAWGGNGSFAQLTEERSMFALVWMPSCHVYLICGQKDGTGGSGTSDTTNVIKIGQDGTPQDAVLLQQSGDTPARRNGNTAAALGDNTIIMVGGSGVGVSGVDVHILSLSSPGVGVWAKRNIAGNMPAGKLYSPVAGYDPRSGLYWIFGGRLSAGYSNETWAYSEPANAWALVPQQVVMPQLCWMWHAIVDQGMLVFGGGQFQIPNQNNLTYALNLNNGTLVGEPFLNGTIPGNAMPCPAPPTTTGIPTLTTGPATTTGIPTLTTGPATTTASIFPAPNPGVSLRASFVMLLAASMLALFC
jgi:hypothetical protein